MSRFHLLFETTQMLIIDRRYPLSETLHRPAYRELTIHAAYAYGPEEWDGSQRETFEIAIDLMRTWGPRLAPLVGSPFRLSEYRAAFATALTVGRSRAVKTVFAIHNG